LDTSMDEVFRIHFSTSYPIGMPYDFVWHCRLHSQSFASWGFADCWTL
jgi:hypothetical protein